MRLLLSLFITTILFLNSSNSLKASELGEAIINKTSEKVSEYVLGWIPGEGHTEFSFDLREESKPQFHILAVRELSKTETGNIFNQFSAKLTEGVNSNTHGNDNDRLMLNYGIGKRFLLDDSNLIIGINNFYDYDFWTTNARTSFGFEAKGPVTDVSINRYIPLSQSGSKELVMSGWDYKIASQVPYAHWAKIFINGYIWEGIDRNNVEGQKWGTEALLNSNLNLEIAYDNKHNSGLEDAWYAHLEYVYPPKKGPTALDGFSAEMWNTKKNMSDELLSKVERSNVIMIEFKGSSKITRTD